MASNPASRVPQGGPGAGAGTGGPAETVAPVALVTAASRGMGAAIARDLAARGYHLVLMARSATVEELAGELGATAVRGSVTEAADLSRMVDTALERHGRIDALVNNTGHPPKGELLAIPDEDWHAGLDLVVLNVIRMARLVTPAMERQGSGSIVNISTFAALEPTPDFPVSATLRSALGTFARLYADRYAGSGIRMNNVLPGFVDSYPIDEATGARIPLGRSGTVKEIAATVGFLLSGDAGYITGQNIVVDGGLTRGV